MSVHVGDRFISLTDEVDHDENDIERVTPAGSVWRIDSIDERGVISAVCDATGGWIFPDEECLAKDFQRSDDSRRYTVSWTIEVDAESPRAAAEHALHIQRDPDSIATQFDVTDDESGREVSIDFHLEEQP